MPMRDSPIKSTVVSPQRAGGCYVVDTTDCPHTVLESQLDTIDRYVQSLIVLSTTNTVSTVGLNGACIPDFSATMLDVISVVASPDYIVSVQLAKHFSGLKRHSFVSARLCMSSLTFDFYCLRCRRQLTI